MEELKLILGALNGLGEGARVGFIWWIVCDKLVPSLLLFTFFSGLVVFIARLVRFICNPDKLGNRCARAIGKGSAADLTPHREDQVVALVREGKAAIYNG